MFSTRQKRKNNSACQKGISLLTIALLLLLLGGALMAGISYFRAQIPGTVASNQKEALIRVDQAIIGFASIHHRVPCPAATPTGDEDCTLAKGFLPAKALNLDVTMFTPGVLPMKYMVYRNAATVDGKEYAHRDLAANQLVSSRVLPYNAYAPVNWDNDALNDKADIEDVGVHQGRYTGREEMDARNGLDMCETMRLAYSAVLSGASANHAHYLRGSTVVNVAYGIAAPGLGDASGNNDRFDGANAESTAQMEPPDRRHGYNYNDYVFVRDLPSLMSAMGCQSAHYNMVEGYSAPIANGSFENLDGYKGNIALETDTEVVNITMPTQLDVIYARDGVVAATVSSVNIVAMMVDAVTEVEALRAFIADNAESTMVSAIQQTVLTAIGIATAAVGLASNIAALAKAIAAIAASLGLHVGAWVAAAAYGVGIALSGVALGLSIAAMGVMIAAAVHAGGVVTALGGDAGKVTEFCNTAGNSIDKDEMLRNLRDQRTQLVNERNKAWNQREAARVEYERLTTAINRCYNGLRDNTPRVTLDNSDPVVTCTATSYDDRHYCFDNTSYNGRGVRIRYEPFRNLSLYQAKETAQQYYDEAIKKRDDLNSKIAELQNTSSIDEMVKKYREALEDSDAANIDAKVAAYRQSLEERRQSDLAKAIAERNGWNAQIPALLTARNNAYQAVTDAENNLWNAGVGDDWTTCTAPQEGRGTVYCTEMYNNYCRFSYKGGGYTADLRYFIVTERRYVETGSYYLQCVFNLHSEEACRFPYYYSIWLEYQRADEAWQTAVENIAKLDANIADVESMNFESCTAGTNKVLLWAVDDAREVLRRVDKRAVLQ